MEPLRVVVASANPVVAGTVGVGIAAGIFEDLGLEVDLEIGGGAQAVNLVVAGDADLTDTNTSAAGAIEAQGRDVSAIWSASGGGLGTSLLVSSDGPATIEELQESAAEGCTFGVTAPGSSSYGYAKTFSEALGLDCELLELGDIAQIVGAVVSGRVDIMVSTTGNPAVSEAISAGELTVLLDSSDPATVDELGLPQFTERVWIGLAENLDEKRESVVRFLEGLRAADEMIGTGPSDEIADLLLTLEGFQAEFPAEEDRERLIASIDQAKPYVNWNDGLISTEDWQLGLDTAASWDIPDFDPADPARSYERMVDMSFYEEAFD